MKSRGQSLVEFALVLPLFLGLLFAIFDIARFMAIYIGMAHGVSAGARVGTFLSSTDTDIRNAVIQGVLVPDPGTLWSAVTITPSPRVAANPVTVAASYTFTFNPAISALLGPLGFGSVTIVQNSTRFAEGP